jgi:hypothetical protein
VAIVVAIPVFLIVLLGSSMCSYSDEIIFRNPVTNNKVIVARSYGCGAYDSDFPVYKFYERTLFLGVLNLYKTVDTAALDKSVWKVAP